MGRTKRKVVPWPDGGSESRRPPCASMMERLIEIACLSPSVGLSQPWRFVIVEDPARRSAVIEDFKACNAKALQAYSGERAAKYAALKLAGLEEAPGHLAVFAEKASDIGHGLGRMTMPETTPIPNDSAKILIQKLEIRR